MTTEFEWFTPSKYPALKLDPERYRTVEERLRFFAENNRLFTNSDITESRDHAVFSDEFVYPVYRLENMMSWYNPLRLVMNTYEDNIYHKYFPLNKYRARLAARLDRVVYSSSNRPANRYLWYNYAWYVDNASVAGDLKYPLRGISEQEYQESVHGASLVLKGLVATLKEVVDEITPEIPIKYYFGLALLLASLGAAGTAYVTGNLKISLYVGGGLVVGLFGMILLIKADDIFASAFASLGSKTTQ